MTKKGYFRVFTISKNRSEGENRLPNCATNMAPIGQKIKTNTFLQALFTVSVVGFFEKSSKMTKKCQNGQNGQNHENAKNDQKGGSKMTPFWDPLFPCLGVKNAVKRPKMGQKRGSKRDPKVTKKGHFGPP